MKIVILISYCLFYIVLFSQTTEQKVQTQLLKLANELRSNPSSFAVKYASQIDDEDLLIEIKNSEKCLALKFDEKLSKNAQTFISGKYYPDDFKGLCGISGDISNILKEEIKTEKELESELIELLVDNFNNFIDPSVIKLGIHCKAGEEIEITLLFGQSCEIEGLKKKFTFQEKIDSSSVNFKLLQTGNSENYLSTFEKEMIKELNFVRQYPAIYAQIIGTFLAQKSEKNGGLEPDEYKASVELIKQLKLMSPVQTLKPSNCIYQAAKKHGLDMQKNSFVGHIGSDQTEPEDRMEKLCKNIISSGENIGGGDVSARIALIELLIDDGISSRGHRENILRSEWNTIGVFYIKKAGVIEHVFVQNFAQF